MDAFKMKIIARVHSEFKTKFAVPRQSGLVEGLEAHIVFEEGYRDANLLRGIEQFSHLWLIWVFSENVNAGWSPTVRPPRLGGNARVGVLATRSPFRPNPIGISCVRLLSVEHTQSEGSVLHIACADLMDRTPILDIKPYIPFTDAQPDAAPGYTAQTLGYSLKVEYACALPASFPKSRLTALSGVLAQDPRPSYHSDPDRIYGFAFADHEVRFRVEGDMLTVLSVQAHSDEDYRKNIQT